MTGHAADDDLPGMWTQADLSGGWADVASSAPATASEGATCTCVVGICREDDEDGCCESPHCPATGVTSSDGDRRLSECAVTFVAEGARIIGCACGWDSEHTTASQAIDAHVEHVLAAGTAQPEGVERVEWGVGCMLPGNVPHTGKAWKTKREAEGSAERLRSIWRSGDAVESAIETIHVVRRTVTEYTPVVGPWEVVGDE